MVRKADGKGAELWKWAGGRWEKVGDVMNAINKDAAGGGGGDRLGGGGRGKDFVFPVDLNGQKYQISMNRGDNVYETATQFIAENGLNEEFLDQIVDFLHANVPDGAGAKVPAAANRNNQELSYNPSPWAESEPPKAKAAPAPQKPFPRSTFVLFDAPGNLAGLAKKAAEFGADAGVLAVLLPKLSGGGAAVTAAEATEVARMLSFDSGKRFPGLDLLRLQALNASGAALVSDGAWTAALAALAGSGPEPMLALKFFANCVRFEPLVRRLGASLGPLLDRCADVASGPARRDAKVWCFPILICILNLGRW